MRVLFDHQAMDAQVRGGVSRYFHELILALSGGELAAARLPRLHTDNEYFRSPRTGPGLLHGMRRARLTGKLVERAWRQARSRLNERASIKELRRQDFDLFHPTYYDPYFLDHLKGKPFVLTIHDMIHEIYPEHFSPRDPTREHKALLAREAAGIIAVSSRTRSDIVRYLEIDPEKIQVIHSANSLTGGGEALAVPASYVLYVGARNRRYKNFGQFFQAFASLAAVHPDLHLVCVNEKGFTRTELDQIERAGLGSRCTNISASDGQLIFLYGHAAVFVYPSLYEGFGLPILEAFAAGCPVALSNSSCFPEVAGDAALYFDPSDVRSMMEAIEIILSDSVWRRALVQRGQERLKKFSWAKTAERTAALYEKCLTAEFTS